MNAKRFLIAALLLSLWYPTTASATRRRMISATNARVARGCLTLVLAASGLTTLGIVRWAHPHRDPAASAAVAVDPEQIRIIRQIMKETLVKRVDSGEGGEDFVNNLVTENFSPHSFSDSELAERKLKPAANSFIRFRTVFEQCPLCKTKSAPQPDAIQLDVEKRYVEGDLFRGRSTGCEDPKLWAIQGLQQSVLMVEEQVLKSIEAGDKQIEEGRFVSSLLTHLLDKSGSIPSYWNNTLYNELINDPTVTGRSRQLVEAIDAYMKSDDATISRVYATLVFESSYQIRRIARPILIHLIREALPREAADELAPLALSEEDDSKERDRQFALKFSHQYAESESSKLIERVLYRYAAKGIGVEVRGAPIATLRIAKRIQADQQAGRMAKVRLIFDPSDSDHPAHSRMRNPSAGLIYREIKNNFGNQ